MFPRVYRPFLIKHGLHGKPHFSPSTPGQILSEAAAYDTTSTHFGDNPSTQSGPIYLANEKELCSASTTCSLKLGCNTHQPLLPNQSSLSFIESWSCWSLLLLLSCSLQRCHVHHSGCDHACPQAVVEYFTYSIEGNPSRGVTHFSYSMLPRSS